MQLGTNTQDNTASADQQLRQTFTDLHALPISPALQTCLDKFRAPKPHTLETMMEGVREFCLIANLSYPQREAFFGHALAGFHYDSAFTVHWNAHHPAKIPFVPKEYCCPPPWLMYSDKLSSRLNFFYAGKHPSEALFKLLQGPFLLDCCVFNELAVWFGLLNMLGPKDFDAAFGRAPLWLTYEVYSEVPKPYQPFYGNPLFSFFTKKVTQDQPAICLDYIRNHPLYRLKHPGGYNTGVNFVRLGNEEHNTLHVFDPDFPEQTVVTAEELQQNLLTSFNADPDQMDANRLVLYTRNPDEVHLDLELTLAQLSLAAKKLAFTKITMEELKKSQEESNKEVRHILPDGFKMFFDLPAFLSWFDKIQATDAATQQAEYQHGLTLLSSTSPITVDGITAENRAVTFEALKHDTPQQQKLLARAERFCADVTSGAPRCLIQTGTPGIGKTAAAAASAKELAAQGKKVVWISETILRARANVLRPPFVHDRLKESAQQLLAENPDAFFLDDVDPKSAAGQVLLAEVYAWYCRNPNKGLFITSSSTDDLFAHCYSSEHYPDYLDYTSAAYLGFSVPSYLEGPSMRPQLSSAQVVETNVDELRHLLVAPMQGPACCRVITPATYAVHKKALVDAEFIPAFDSETELKPIQGALLGGQLTAVLAKRLAPLDEYNTPPVYQRMDGKHKSWLMVSKPFESREAHNEPAQTLEEFVTHSVPVLSVKHFQQTTQEIIVVEIKTETSSGANQEIRFQSDFLVNLLRVVNYAFDMGNKKIIFLNHTTFSPQELLEQLIQAFPAENRESFRVRLGMMLAQPTPTLAPAAALSEDDAYANLAKPKKKTLDIPQPLLDLHASAPPAQLRQFLDTLRTPKARTIENFMACMPAFYAVANKPYAERANYFGSVFGGLHYAVDLANRWNEAYPAQKIAAHDLKLLCPPPWKAHGDEKTGYVVFVYSGASLSAALDKLLQGPTVIDCNRFAQLTFWLAMRNILGDDLLDKIFAHIPFLITGFCYEDFPKPEMPYTGNPLFKFFKQQPDPHKTQVSIERIANHHSYPVKHPGGAGAGQNFVRCKVSQQSHVLIFEPSLAFDTTGGVDLLERWLIEEFNADPDENTMAVIEQYELHPTTMHPQHKQPFGTLARLAKSLASYKINVENLRASQQKQERMLGGEKLQIYFDFEAFLQWVGEMREKKLTTQVFNGARWRDPQLQNLRYFLDFVPQENRDLTFANFRQDTPLQRYLFARTSKFCLAVTSGQPSCLVVIGKPGVGKTASATVCAKELTRQKKKIRWISEPLLRSCVGNIPQLFEADKYTQYIHGLLRENPDVIILDNIDCASVAGKTLLREFYRWYVTNPNKGLLITTNAKEPFGCCYDDRECPPYLEYTSLAFHNLVITDYLDGPSMRPEPNYFALGNADETKFTDFLTTPLQDVSRCCIVTPAVFATHRADLAGAEFVPAFDSLTQLHPIHVSLFAAADKMPVTKKDATVEDYCMPKEYQEMDAQHKSWLAISKMSDQFDEAVFAAAGLEDSLSILCTPMLSVRQFQKTAKPLIAVEIRTETAYQQNRALCFQKDCLSNLLKVVNYAFDNGEKKVVLINYSEFPPRELIERLVQAMPLEDKEAFRVRLGLLLSPSMPTPARTDMVDTVEVPAVTTGVHSPGVLSVFALKGGVPRPALELRQHVSSQGGPASVGKMCPGSQ